MKETPGVTRQCRRSNFARDEARSGQERTKSIANLIERRQELGLSKAVQVLRYKMHIPCVHISRFWRAHVKHSF